MADNKNIEDELKTVKDITNLTQKLAKQLESDFDAASSSVEDFVKSLQKSKREFSDIEKSSAGILDFTKKVESRTEAIEGLQKLINAGVTKQLNIGEQISESAKLVNLADKERTDENLRLGIAKNKMLYLDGKLLFYSQQLNKLSDEGMAGKITSASHTRKLIAYTERVKKFEEERTKISAEKNSLDGTNHNQLLAQQKVLNDSLLKYKEMLSVESSRQSKLMVINSLFSKTIAKNEDFIKLATLGTNLMKGGAAAYVAILEVAIDRWIQLDAAAGKFRKTTGLLITQTIQVRKAIEQANVSLSYIGVTLEDANSAAEQLVGVFGTVSLVSSDMVIGSAKLAANLGLSATSIGEINSLFASSARSSGTTANNVILSAAKLSEMAGVAPKQVMEDMAKSSNNTLVFLSKNPMQLMRAAVEARRLGTNLNSISDSARGMLDYQSSMTSELEASSLLNKNISFQISRQLAWEGKIVESREAALDQIKAAGDFTRMTVYQQEALAKAANMTVAEVSKQLNQREMLAALQYSENEQDRAQYSAYVKMNAKLKADDADAKKDLLGRGREMAKQMLMQAEMDKLASSLKSAWISIQDALLPIANAIMPSIIGGLRIIGSVIRMISGLVKLAFLPFQSLLNMIPKMAGGLSIIEEIMVVMESGISHIAGWAKQFSEWLDKSEETGSSTVKWVLGISGALVAILVPLGSILVMSKGIGSMWSIGGSLFSGVSGFGKKIFDATKGLFGMSSAAKNAAVSVSKLSPNVPASNGLGGLSKFLSGIKWKDVLTAAAAMVILAGGLWVLGESLNKFKTIDWESIGKAAAVLVGLAVLGLIVGKFPAVAAGMLAVGAAATLLGVGLLAAGAGFAMFGKGIEFVGAGISKVIDSISGGISKVIGAISGGVTAAADSLVKIVQPIKDLSDLGVVKLTKVAIGISSIASSLRELSESFGGKEMFRNLTSLTDLSNKLNLISESLMNIKQNSSFDIKISGIKEFQELMKNPIDMTTKIGNQIKVAVEPVAVEIKNLDSLKEVVAQLTAAVVKLGGTAGSAATVVNTTPNDNSAMIAKLDELIGLLKSGGIAVNLDGRKVSSGLSVAGR